MYMKSKYVVGRTADGTLNAVVGSELINHRDLARVFAEVVSAGFCHSNDDEVKVYGSSVSLKIESNPKVDTELVGRAMSHPKYVIY